MPISYFQGETILRIDKLVHNFRPRETDPPNDNLAQVKIAQFYYLDKFFLVAHRRATTLYKYYLDETVDDVKRYSTNSHYRQVRRNLQIS
jgi:hypothetical protein